MVDGSAAAAAAMAAAVAATVAATPSMQDLRQAHWSRDPGWPQDPFEGGGALLGSGATAGAEPTTAAAAAARKSLDFERRMNKADDGEASQHSKQQPAFRDEPSVRFRENPISSSLQEDPPPPPRPHQPAGRGGSCSGEAAEGGAGSLSQSDSLMTQHRSILKTSSSMTRIASMTRQASLTRQPLRQASLLRHGGDGTDPPMLSLQSLSPVLVPDSTPAAAAASGALGESVRGRFSSEEAGRTMAGGRVATSSSSRGGSSRSSSLPRSSAAVPEVTW